MLIHFVERDPRKNDPDFLETCGSFSAIQEILKKGLRELGIYTEDVNEATHAGVADSLMTDFYIPDKKCFGVYFVDTINTIPTIALRRAYQNVNLKLFSINQHTAGLYGLYGFQCQEIGPGIDPDYWYPTKEKYDKFTFISTGYSNFRSGIDLLIRAYDLAFCGNEDIQLIIKDTSNSDRFAERISDYQYKGNNIQHITGRWTFSQLRDLYSSSHVCCNVLRMSGHGLPIAESTLCGCLSITGDFNPSNKINCGVLLHTEEQVLVSEVMPELVNHWGLVDTFQGLDFPEPPRIYSYNLEQYAETLKYIYNNYNNYDRKKNREVMVDKWDYKKSAQNLVNYLSFS